MINSYDNEKWEELLKAAVIKNSLDELEKYTSEEEEEAAIPESLDRKMRELIERLTAES